MISVNQPIRLHNTIRLPKVQLTLRLQCYAKFSAFLSDKIDFAEQTSFPAHVKTDYESFS